MFDDTGVTGNPDHKAATRAALSVAVAAGLPVLAWTLAVTIAGRLREETGEPFTGRQPSEVDLCIRVDRAGSAGLRSCTPPTSRPPPR